MVQAVDSVEDLSYAARNMIEGAIAVTTGRLHLESPDETLARVRENDSVALEQFRHELAHQIAMLLLRMDVSVMAVYKEHEIWNSVEGEPSTLTLTDPIHLVVYSQRETAALRSLVRALDRSLVDAVARYCGQISSGWIDVEFIDRTKAMRVYARATGFRPAPTKLVSRGIQRNQGNQ